MKRTVAVQILAVAGGLFGAVPVAGELHASSQQPGVSLRAHSLVTLRDGEPARLCAGARNAARLTIGIEGGAPRGAIPVRLALVVPGAGPGGFLVGEGSVSPAPAARTVTFTFLNLELPVRMRGRGVRLVAQVNADGSVPEADTSDNSVSLALDEITDWSCSSTRS